MMSLNPKVQNAPPSILSDLVLQAKGLRQQLRHQQAIALQANWGTTNADPT